MIESTIHRIIRKTGRKPVECKCKLCQMQCSTPCLGTPEDIEKLLDAGYREQLALYDWDVAKVMGKLGFSILMIQAHTKNGMCVFFENGLCTLHDKGLKPREGRLSHHTQKLETFVFKKSLSWNVAKEWINEDNADTLKRIAEKFRK